MKISKEQLKQIIREEYQNLITEKFASKNAAALAKKLSNWDRQVFAALSKTYGLPWDAMDANSVTKIANPAQTQINFFFKGNTLIGVTKGKQFVDRQGRKTGRPDKPSRTRGSMGNDAGPNWESGYYNSFKRVSQDATEVFSVDLTAFVGKDDARDKRAARIEARKGATALMSARELVRANKDRYARLINQRASLGVDGSKDVLDGIVDKAKNLFDQAVNKHLTMLKQGKVLGGWDNFYSTATYQMKNIMDEYQSYIRTVADVAKAKEMEDGNLEKQLTIEYYTKNQTTTAKSIAIKFKEFEKALNKLDAQTPIDIK